MAKLAPGDRAPKFALKDQDGKTVKLGDFSGRKVLVYFYPKADTPGCTTQSCAVRDARTDLAGRGIAVDASYFRRIWGNFQVTDNLALAPEDFTQFNLTVPSDPRLPGGGGYTVTGLYDVKPEKFGQQQNYNTLSDKFGKQIEHWDGVDVNLSARLQNGLMFQGGVSSGRTLEDNCEIVAKLPEMLNLTGAQASNTPATPAMWRPAQYCHRASPMLTQFKGYDVYTVPRIEVQLAGTFRSTPGNDINAAFAASNQFLATNSTLGRPLSGGAANLTVGLLSPN